MIVCNAFVWTFFVKALHQKGGSIVATVTSTATNYCCSVWLLWMQFFVSHWNILNQIVWHRKLKYHYFMVILLQAFTGHWIFGEQISALWWLGSVFIIAGLICVSLGSDNRSESSNNTSDNQNKEKQMWLIKKMTVIFTQIFMRNFDLFFSTKTTGHKEEWHY